MSTRAKTLRRWLTVAAGTGFLALLAAFVPSPLRVMDLFDKPVEVTVQRPPKLVLREMPAISAYSEVTARPLFNSGRVPDPETTVGLAPSPAAVAQGPGELSEFRLVGIVTDSTTKLAIVERSGAPSLKVAPGDQLAGWRIDRIDASGLVATKDARSVRLGIPKARQRVDTP
jgi:hypothetical protein